MKRAILWFLGIFALLLTLLVTAAGALLGTESGTAWALGKAQEMAPDMLSIERVQGHLLDRLVLGDVTVNLASADIELEELTFDWSPARLLRRNLLVNELTLATLRIQSKPVPEEPEEPLTWPIELPAIAPPVDVMITTVDITDVEFYSTPEAAPVVVEAAGLGAYWNAAEGVVLERLEARGPGFDLALDGGVDPLDNYLLQLRDRVALTLEDGTAFELTGTINGPIAGGAGQLALDQQLSGAADLGLTGTILKPLLDPAWQLSLQLEALSSALLGEGLPLALSGQLDSQGSFNPGTTEGVAEVSGQFVSASEQVEFDALDAQLQLTADLGQQQATLQRLELTQGGQPLRLTLAGDVSAEAVALEGDWEALQWPPGAEPAFRSQRGELSLNGPFSGYRIELLADVDGQSIPPGQWQLNGTGDEQKLKLEGLIGRLLDGELKLSGDVAWAPQVDWNLQVGAATIRPGELLAVDPDAVFNLQLATTGRLEETGPVAEVELQEVGGTLIGQPLSGGGRLSYSSQGITIEDLALRNADMVLSADGSLGEQSDLGWQLQLPALGQLLPDAQGQISGEGRVSGPMTTPRIVAAMDIAGVEHQQFKVEKLTADIDLDLQDQSASRLRVDGSALASGEQVVQQLALAFDGYLREHDLSLSATHPQASLGLALAGGYDRDSGLWSGTLDQLDIDSEPAGDWRLQQPAALVLGANQANADALCLTREQAKLCAEGDWQAPAQAGAQGATKGSFELAGLRLDWFEAFLPDQLRSLNGVLSANGEFSQQQELEAVLAARLTPGELVFVGEGGDVAMEHTGMELDVNAAGAGAAAVLRAGVGDSTVSADVKLPDVLQVDDPIQAKLAGEVALEVPDLDIVQLLAPTVVESIDGDVDARFALGGQVGNPDIEGGARLAIADVDLPSAGLQLADTLFEVDIADRVATINGELTSGGRLDISGKAELDPDSGWPLAIAIAGEEFVATDLPNMQVLISPDLKIARDADGLAVTGQVTVPQAEILVRSLPPGSRSASSDVVIVRGGEEPETAAPVTTDLTVVLGDKVHVAALGLNAFLKGELALGADPGQPLRATGDIRIDQGTFRAFSQEMVIERGLFSFTDSPMDNPGINVRAVRPIDDVEVGVNVLGSARKMTITTFSTPAMSENDRISYLVTGKPASEGANLSINRQIAENLSVGISVDTYTGERAFVTRYRLNRTLHTEVGSSERSSTLDLFYTLERQ